jgi:MFS family permease
VSLAALSFGVIMALMAVVPRFAVAVPLAAVLGFCSITFVVSSTAIVQLRAAPEMRGRVLAIQAMLFLGSTPIGGPIVGWVAQQYGARWSVAIGSAAAVGAGLWGLAAMRRTPEGDLAGHVASSLPAAAPELAVEAAVEADVGIGEMQGTLRA